MYDERDSLTSRHKRKTKSRLRYTNLFGKKKGVFISFSRRFYYITFKHETVSGWRQKKTQSITRVVRVYPCPNSFH